MNHGQFSLSEKNAQILGPNKKVCKMLKYFISCYSKWVYFKSKIVLEQFELKLNIYITCTYKNLLKEKYFDYLLKKYDT